jgi:hypothetical protein
MMGTTIARQSTSKRAAATKSALEAGTDEPEPAWGRKTAQFTAHLRFQRAAHAAAAGGGGQRTLALRHPVKGDRQQWRLAAPVCEGIVRPGDSSQRLSLRHFGLQR